MPVRDKHLLGVVLLFSIGACSPAQRTDTPRDAGVLRVAVLPDQAEQLLRRRYTPLMDYLEATIDRKTELVVPPGYQELLDLFATGRIDLAWLGGLTFIKAERRSGAVPLVMRDIDLEFTTDFLVRREAPGESLEDYSGLRFSFGPALSTSGHLMPRHHLHQRGVQPETFFGEVLHSAGHDQTVAWVRDGTVDVGAANSVVVESLLRSDRVSSDKVRILETTAPYRNYVWAVRPDLDRRLRTSLTDAFLALDPTVPTQRAILAAVGARGFIPASSKDYEELRVAADSYGLMLDEGST